MWLNKTKFASYITGFVFNMTGIVPNLIGFALYMTGFDYGDDCEQKIMAYITVLHVSCYQRKLLQGVWHWLVCLVSTS